MKNKTIYITLTGLRHYYGHEILEPGMIVKLKKEPKNEFDSEAIKAKIPGLGKIGYVANSPYTVAGDSWSAGRIYDKFKKKAHCRVLYVLKGCALCEFLPNYTDSNEDCVPLILEEEVIGEEC